MRKLLYIFLFFNLLVSAQINPDNRFSQAEKQEEVQANQNLKKPQEDNSLTGRPGNPGETMPIDNGVFLLFFAGLGIMIAVSKREKLIKTSK